MIPESKLIRSELTLREMSLPEETKLTRKSLIRWVALSFGLIHPNESRKLLLDVLEVLFMYHVKNTTPTTQHVLDSLKELDGKDPNPKAVYYHLLKLKEAGLISRKKGQYYFDDEGKTLSETFKVFYQKKFNESFKNIDEALKKLETNY
ncbi:MAG: hypothetical protein ABII22_04310 [Candidatus Micrarchaeota archaeon]